MDENKKGSGMVGEQDGDDSGGGLGREAAGRPLAGRLWLAVRVVRALLMLGVAGCAVMPGTTTQVPAAPEVIRSSVRFQKEYLLAAGDQIEISVWRVPEISRTVFVRPDGFISLPLLQEIKAAGLTPKELAANVTKALSGRLVNPEVTVIPILVRQPNIYVLGDVRSPGAFLARTAVTAAQALALAGGVLRSGYEGGTVLIRLTDDGYLEAIPIGDGFSVSQVAPYLSLASTVLKPDDIIFVPESGRSQIFRSLSDILVPFQIYLNYKLIQEIVP